MNYWLIKTEPGTYSWSDFKKEKKTNWDGVRNFQARNNLKAMLKGDLAFFYHSGKDREIVGIARVTKPYFPDPLDNDWVAVEVALERELERPVSLSQVKSNKQLADMVLVRSSRLSVQPVQKKEFDIIVGMG